jgi:dipeptidyl aminopeptidase/acylaminoacyl peptidase
MNHRQVLSASKKGTWFFLALALTTWIGCSSRPSTPVVAVEPDVSSEPTVLTNSQLGRDAARAPRIASLLGATQNYGAVLSPDGTKVLFRSDRDGVTALYLSEVGKPDAPAKKLVGGPERVASAIFAENGQSILFRQDVGYDETFHILRVGVDGTGVTDLTPDGALWRDSPLLPKGKADTMVYASRTPTVLASTLMVQTISPSAPRIVFRDPLAGWAVDVTSDGTRVLWVHEAVAGGRELFEIDVATGESRLIASPHVSAAAYAADGGRIFVGTDNGAETHVLVALDAKSRTVLAEYRQTSPSTAQVNSVVPSPRGDRVAIAIDAGNRSMVRILDAKTLAVVRDIASPLGTATLGVDTEVRYALGGGTFAADGAHFVIGLSAPDLPDNVFVVDTETGTIAPLRRDQRVDLGSLPPIVTSIATVDAFDGLQIQVNVHLPKERQAKLTTLVYFHGGPDASTPLEWNSWTRALTTFGFAVIEPNIRGSTGFGRAYAAADDKEKRVDALRDMESVNQWARRQDWCDGERIVLYGASYGGYLVLMGLTRQPKLWSAGVDVAGIADLMTLLQSGSSAPRYITEFGVPDKDAALINAFSPIHDADKIVAPLFIYQGQNDSRVPRVHADIMVRALRSRHVPVEYMVAANEGHSVGHRENQVAFLARAVRFLEDQLGMRASGP